MSRALSSHATWIVWEIGKICNILNNLVYFFTVFNDNLIYTFSEMKEDARVT